MIVALLVAGRVWAQAPAPSPSPSPSSNPLLRGKQQPIALPIPPMPTGSSGPTSTEAPGLAPQRVFPMPLNLKEIYTRINARPEWLSTDTLFAASVFEVTVGPDGRLQSSRVVRYKSFELTEAFREALTELRCAPETLAERPQEGRTFVALVWPPPQPQPASAADSLPPDLEAHPINLDQLRAMVGYPMRARAERLQGRVAIRVLVNEYGLYVRHSVLQSPSPILTEAVEAWIYHLRFIPAFRGRKPVRTWLTVPFDFKPV